MRIVRSTTGKAVIGLRKSERGRKIAIALCALSAAGIIATLTALGARAQSSPPATPGCRLMSGVALGLTKAFAEYEAFQSIRLATGNWPIETDRISRPVYACKRDGVMWRCRAEARVCRH